MIEKQNKDKYKTVVKAPIKTIVTKIVIMIVSLLVLAAACVLTYFYIYTADKNFAIENIAIHVNDAYINESIEKEFTAEDFTLSLVINNGKNDNFKKPLIEWSIIGNDLNCEIDNNGNFKIGDTLGTVTIQVKVISQNEMSKEITVNIFASNDLELESLEAIISESGLNFIEGQSFSYNEVEILLHFLNQSKTVFSNDYTFSQEPLTILDNVITISYLHAGITKTTTIPITVIPKSLKSIEVLNEPKTHYVEGEYFDRTGLVVVANYEYIFGVEIINYTIANDDILLNPLIAYFTISYTENGVTETVILPITVSQKELQDITLDISNVKKQYTQGELFDPVGLIVTVHYQVFSQIIINYLIDKTSWLISTDNEIVISYTENEKTISKTIPITVYAPYSTLRTVQFENPFDASLSWNYSYRTDDGEIVSENTEFEDYEGVEYEPETGIYCIPVGATVTLSIVNPTINAFVFNGITHEINYPEKTLDFELQDGTIPLIISFEKSLGEKITVRFENGVYGQKWAFVYPPDWNEPMRASDLEQLSQIYEETEDYYFLFTINGEEKTFSELAVTDITENIFINVSQIERPEFDETISINIEYYNDILIQVVLNQNDENTLSLLPQFERIGYSFDGFSSLQTGGIIFDETSFANWLATSFDNMTIYAYYTFNAISQSGNFIGTWQYEEIIDEIVYGLTITFNSNGTYNYISTVNGIDNCNFSGIFEEIDNVINILSIETSAEYLFVNPTDFEITFNINTLNLTIFIVNDFIVTSWQISITI